MATSEKKAFEVNLWNVWQWSIGASIVVSYLIFFYYSFEFQQEPRNITLTSMGYLACCLRDYQNQHKVYPDTLSQLFEGKNVDENLLLKDYWKNPFVYTLNGDSWTLMSYGADGRPSGVGLDTDFSIDQTWFHFNKTKYEKIREELHKTAKPTVGQALATSGIFIPVNVFISGVCSLLALLAYFMTQKRENSSETATETDRADLWGVFWMTLVSTAFFSFVLASLIAFSGPIRK